MRLVSTAALCFQAKRRSDIFRLTFWGSVQKLDAMCRSRKVTLEDNCFFQKLQTVRLGSEHTVV